MKCCSESVGCRGISSLSSWRAWIEIMDMYGMSIQDCSRSPHGERGLKSASSLTGGWRKRGRSPHGERGLKYAGTASTSERKSRSPHGERGLKSDYGENAGGHIQSLSSWRAWIEIFSHCYHSLIDGSLSSWRAWIEISTT